MLGWLRPSGLEDSNVSSTLPSDTRVPRSTFTGPRATDGAAASIVESAKRVGYLAVPDASLLLAMSFIVETFDKLGLAVGAPPRRAPVLGRV